MVLSRRKRQLPPPDHFGGGFFLRDRGFWEGDSERGKRKVGYWLMLSHPAPYGHKLLFGSPVYLPFNGGRGFRFAGLLTLTHIAL